MSVKQELLDLKEAREGLRKELEDVNSTFTSLYNSKLLLEQKVESLRTRTSALAKSLLEKAQKDLDALTLEVDAVQEQKTQLEQALEENQKNISEREEDFSLYIQEQSNMMVSTFLEYLKSHSEEIGLELRKTYSFIPVTSYQKDRYGGCHVPTGNFGIYDTTTKTFVISSSNFYFGKVLYTFSRGTYDELICHTSNWYKQYKSRFVSVFLDTLAEHYNYGKTFKLTFNGRDFTLELV